MALAPIISDTMQEIVTRALNSERGIAITFNTEGEAIHWRQRYYKVRARITKSDPTSEWRTLSAILDGKRVKLVPTDSQLLDLNIEEL